MLRRMNGYTGWSLPGNLYSITIYVHTALKNCNSDDLIDVLRNIDNGPTVSFRYQRD